MLFTIIARLLFTKLGVHSRNVEVYKLFMKFDTEKFDGRINFDMWQVQVKDAVTQSRLYKLQVRSYQYMSHESHLRRTVYILMVCPLCYGRGYVTPNGSTSLRALVWCWCMVCGEIYVHGWWNLGKAKRESCTITFQQVFQHVMNWNSLNC